MYLDEVLPGAGLWVCVEVDGARVAVDPIDVPDLTPAPSDPRP